MGDTIIIGAGPAGLTAAFELCKLQRSAVVVEKDCIVGGLARTVCHKGYRFDLGGHRFFTKVAEVRRIWYEVLGEDLLTRPRLSRIHYNGKFFNYPLKPANALVGLGALEAARIFLSYARARLFPSAEERTFEQWVVNRFGRRLYEIFFKTYTEKVWGMPCNEIGAEWASQRIRNLDLATAVKDAVLGTGTRRGEVVTTLIDQFLYPRLGPGMMWERCRDLVARKGVETVLGANVVELRHRDSRVVSAVIERADGRQEISGESFISSMPIPELVRALNPRPPDQVLAAAERLRYRDFLAVALVIDRADVFPDNWIYIHSPEVHLGRIQNFKNWSADMVPDATKSCLGLEYFVQEDDELWKREDEELLALGRRECARLGLIQEREAIDGMVVRMSKAYPIYDRGYRQALSTIRFYLCGLGNLYLIGRNGQHRYNNQDHSMLTGIYAARNSAGASYDVWDVNTEGSYLEGEAPRDMEALARAVPRPV